MQTSEDISINYLMSILDQFYPADADWSDYENLMECLRIGDKRSVINLLLKGCRVVRPGTFNTPLHLAVERTGWSYIVKQLLDRGARVSYINSNNDTALHHAFFYEAPEMSINSMVASYLKDSNENLVNDEGFTYLHIMSARSNLASVKELLKGRNVYINSQVNMNSKSRYAGYSALHFAVEFNKIDIADYLLKNNASIYTKTPNGTTPLHLACYQGNVEMIDVLLAYEQAFINVADNFGTSHFMASCLSTNSNYARKYVVVAYRRFQTLPSDLARARMSDSVASPFAGYTPLHFATHYGRQETVLILLKCGSLSTTRNTAGETPFSIASKHDYTNICKILKKHWQAYQAYLYRKQMCSLAQNQANAKFAISSTPVTSNINATCQNYSAPNIFYVTPRSVEQRGTAVN